MNSQTTYYDYILSGNIRPEDIKKRNRLHGYFSYNKIYTRTKADEKKDKTIEEIYKNDKEILYKHYTFIDRSETESVFGRYRKCKITDFPFAWLKDNIFKSTNRSKREFEFETEAEKYSGIKSMADLQKYVRKLPPYSFALSAKIKLTAPYFSRDDDNSYLIDNPVLKERVFKAPMVRGSGWKGSMVAAAKKLIINDLDNFLPFARIFGLGSSEYRDLITSLTEEQDKLKSRIIKFSLFKLGLELDKEDIDTINNEPQEFLNKIAYGLTAENVKNKTLVSYLQPHRGRAVFYPTFFNKLSLEIINPHDKKRRVGTIPIFYEIVPEGAEGRLQVVYIPYDTVLTDTQTIIKQVKDDFDFMCNTIERTADQGVGAKNKLGWGRFELSDKKYCINCLDSNNFTVEGWNRC
jgi:CRISPR-associated protein Cmr2